MNFWGQQIMKNTKHGFTLIELVIVIVILAIIAALSIPKFINLSGDAESAVVNGLKGALIEGSNLVHAKASIEKLDAGNQTMTLNGGDISLRAGYPRVAGNCNNFTNQLDYWLSINLDDAICTGSESEDWYGVVQSNAFHFMPSGYESIAENCYVTYTTASERIGGVWVDTDSATIFSDVSGCGE